MSIAKCVRFSDNLAFLFRHSLDVGYLNCLGILYNNNAIDIYWLIFSFFLGKHLYMELLCALLWQGALPKISGETSFPYNIEKWEYQWGEVVIPGRRVYESAVHLIPHFHAFLLCVPQGSHQIGAPAFNSLATRTMCQENFGLHNLLSLWYSVIITDEEKGSHGSLVRK